VEDEGLYVSDTVSGQDYRIFKIYKKAIV